MLHLSSLACPPLNAKYFVFFLATISVLAASLLIPLICGNRAILTVVHMSQLCRCLLLRCLWVCDWGEKKGRTGKIRSRDSSRRENLGHDSGPPSSPIPTTSSQRPHSFLRPSPSHHTPITSPPLSLPPPVCSYSRQAKFPELTLN